MKKSYVKPLFMMLTAMFALGSIQSVAVAETKYKVIKGDTLGQLSKQYGVTIKDIMDENNRTDDWIYEGETLRIPEKPNGQDIDELISDAKVPEEEAVKAAETEESNQPAEAEEVKAEPQPAPEAMSISQGEKDLLARLVEAEAKGESYEGKLGVAIVVLNRVESQQFPNSVNGVIMEVVGTSYAFSPVQNGSINKPASDEAHRAVEEALMRKDRLNDSIYFYNPNTATDDWIRSRQVVKTIGNHVFAK
ncbi:cell wall hydrolase [Priestia flexa]|uniref:cell wall hydrolase n=1 Tax=Priestia flexa TaxID=86664 RepID=UPI0032ED61A1